MLLSVIIPTYNPNLTRLNQTLLGLQKQTLTLKYWELIIIDNNSSSSFEKEIDIFWHPNSKIILEKKQGLTNARIKGFKNSKGGVIVMVDDDNILEENYLENVISFFNENRQVGAVGGKSLAIFEDFVPEKWSLEFLSMIAVRDLGNEILVSEKKLNSYPPCSPIGAGMAIRTNLLQKYIDHVDQNNNQTTDRIGNSLASGGDNEINIFILKQGYAVAYFPKLVLHHIIPKFRLTKSYLARLNYESTISWVKLLGKYYIYPWKQIPKSTLLLRQLKAYFVIGAWKNPSAYIKWKGACGKLLAQSEITSKPSY